MIDAIHKAVAPVLMLIGLKESDMLECAIPQCEGREKFLRSGTLHLVDCKGSDGAIGKKMVWLCALCTQQYIVQTWRPAGEQIRPRLNIPVHEFADVLGNAPSLPDDATKSVIVSDNEIQGIGTH